MHALAGLAALVLPALTLQAAGPIPFELTRLEDKGGKVEVDYQLLLPPPGGAAGEKIRARLLAEFFPEEEHPGATPPRVLMARAQGQLFKEFDEAYGGSTEPTQQRWSDVRRQRVSFESPTLLVIEHSKQSYLGGAHANHEIVYLVFDLRTGEEQVLADLFLPGAEESLIPRIKLAIRQKARIGDEADLNQHGYWEKDIRPQNLFVEADGIGFHFNPYEIAPWAMGETVVHLPWASVRSLIKPTGALAGLAGVAP